MTPQDIVVAHLWVLRSERCVVGENEKYLKWSAGLFVLFPAFSLVVFVTIVNAMATAAFVSGWFLTYVAFTFFNHSIFV